MACLMVAATLRPLAISAAARKSSIRELVHEPMKTRSSWISVIAWLALKPMYFKARSMEPRLTRSASAAGSGTR
ncbi:hypothetical protein D3C76_1350430 [compost metagenome]